MRKVVASIILCLLIAGCGTHVETDNTEKLEDTVVSEDIVAEETDATPDEVSDTDEEPLDSGAIEEQNETEKEDVKKEAQSESLDVDEESVAEEKARIEAEEAAKAEAERLAQEVAEAEKQAAEEAERIAEEEAEAEEETNAQDESPGEYVWKDSIEKEIFALTNQFRVENGVAPLEWDESLRVSARDHTQMIYSQEIFEHTSVYNVGENLFTMGSTDASNFTAETAVNAWINSPGHRANMLNASYTKFGAAFLVGELYYSEYTMRLPTLYATQHFK